MRVFVICLVVCVAAPAAADNPWSRGVAPERQARAGTLFAHGTKLMQDGLWQEALVEYRKALKHWDNPAIYGNMVICLVSLNRPIDGYKLLKRALKYGAAPFRPAAYRRLVVLRRLLAGQISELIIGTRQPGTRILIDNKRLLVGPGSKRFAVRAGRHRVVASRPGHLPRNELVTLTPGKLHRLNVRLDSFAEATTYSRRFRPWKTWAVLGGAGALLAASVGFYLRSDFLLSSYTLSLDMRCPDGCNMADLPPEYARTKRRGELYSQIGAVAGTVGLTAAVAAGAMWLVNRTKVKQRRRYPKPLPMRVVVTPVRGGGALVGSMTF